MRSIISALGCVLCVGIYFPYSGALATGLVCREADTHARAQLLNPESRRTERIERRNASRGRNRLLRTVTTEHPVTVAPGRVMLGHTCEMLAVMYLQRGPPMRSMRSMRSMRGGFIFRNRGPSLKVHPCQHLASVPPIAENESTTHRTHRTHRVTPPGCLCVLCVVCMVVLCLVRERLILIL
jgi:hypothetical protein